MVDRRPSRQTANGKDTVICIAGTLVIEVVVTEEHASRSI